MKKILVVAPHADDETLGCGGALLRHYFYNDEVNCIIVTNVKKNTKKFFKRKEQNKLIKKKYHFKNLIQGNFINSKLHIYDANKLINFFSKVVLKIKPDLLYVPFREDAHSDHKIIYDTISPLFKSFRYPFIKEVRVYETLSETNFKNSINKNSFEPNLYVNISKYLKNKIEIMKIYKSEIGKHPFPRSVKSIEALAILRGSYSGHKYAEAFRVIKKIYD